MAKASFLVLRTCSDGGCGGIVAMIISYYVYYSKVGNYSCRIPFSFLGAESLELLQETRHDVECF